MTETEPRRVSRRLGALSQAAMAACSCSSHQRCSAAAGGMLRIGSSRLLKEALFLIALA